MNKPKVKPFLAFLKGTKIRIALFKKKTNNFGTERLKGFSDRPVFVIKMNANYQ